MNLEFSKAAYTADPKSSSGSLRVAVLWPRVTGFLNACIRELVLGQKVEVLVSAAFPNAEAPFAEEEFAWISHRHVHKDGKPEAGPLLRRLEEFAPDGILVSSWHVPAYREVCRKLRGRCVRILCMDNQWRGTVKQRLGALAAPWYVRPLYDGVFLPGRRQAKFAERLGFDGSRVFTGLLSCDRNAFLQAVENRASNGKERVRKFLYVGRLVAIKRIDLLVAAYRRYRQSVRDPWPLVIAGEGPLRHLVSDIEGIECRGFVQPRDLPQSFAEASCLILPSSYEPWGVVIHEAVCAGLAVICSGACGAADHLVRERRNGFVFNDQNPETLARLMADYSLLSDAERRAMEDASIELSRQFTPELWAQTVVKAVRSLQPTCSDEELRFGG